MSLTGSAQVFRGQISSMAKKILSVASEFLSLLVGQVGMGKRIVTGGHDFPCSSQPIRISPISDSNTDHYEKIKPFLLATPAKTNVIFVAIILSKIPLRTTHHLHTTFIPLYLIYRNYAPNEASLPILIICLISVVRRQIRIHVNFCHTGTGTTGKIAYA